MPVKYEYRIEERILDNGKSEFMPQRKETYAKKQSLYESFFQKVKNPYAQWESIASFHCQEYDRGYQTIERAQQDIDKDRAKRAPEVVKIIIHDEEELHALTYPHA